MSLEEGAINYTDLSPNANIQGHQIADKTLRLRNLSDDTFGIVYTGTGTTPSVSIADGGAGVWSRAGASNTAYAHNLGYIPSVLGFITVGGNNIAMPYSVFDSSSSGATWVQYYITIDNSNVYLGTVVLGVHLALTVAVQAVKFYILQESATA